VFIGRKKPATGHKACRGSVETPGPGGVDGKGGEEGDIWETRDSEGGKGQNDKSRPGMQPGTVRD